MLVQLVFAQVLPFQSMLFRGAGYGCMCVRIVCMCAHMPHNWMNVGIWCCSSFASVRLPDSATSNINQSHIFSGSIPYIIKEHYGFFVGSGFFANLDDDLI